MGMYLALRNVDECSRGGFERALIEPEGKGPVDHVVVLVLERVRVEWCPAAVGRKVSLDHRERSTSLFPSRLDHVGVAKERSRLTFSAQPDNAATSCFATR